MHGFISSLLDNILKSDSPPSKLIIWKEQQGENHMKYLNEFDWQMNRDEGA